MSDHQSLTLQKAGEIMEAVIARGDIASLTPEERARFYTRTCESLGLNPMTQPFAFITLNGKLTLYARKDATDQLRQIHNISVTELTESERDGVFIVTAKVRNSQGRTDAAKGAVTINGLKGDNLANALMKAETKAKRRATLSICGLGFLDETELETISTTEKTLPKKDARDIYTKLQTAIDTAQSRVGLKAWLNANADRIKTMPEDWQDILHLRAEEKLADLREQEANTQVDVEPVVVTSTLDEAPATGEVVWDDPPQMDDKKWDHLKPSQQAGILCGDLAFRRFLQVDTGEQAAEAVRNHCIVSSRSQIKQNHASGRLWRELVARYRAWLNDGDLDLSPQPSTNPTLTTAADAPPDAHKSPASGGDEEDRIEQLDKALTEAAKDGVDALRAELKSFAKIDRDRLMSAVERRHLPAARAVDAAKIAAPQ